MFPGCFQAFSGCFQGVSRRFQAFSGCFQGVSRVFSGCFQGVFSGRLICAPAVHKNPVP